MEPDEKKIKQEDCSEDKLGPGILTLTNKRIAFDKTKGRIMDFSKKFGETVLDVKLGDVKKVWKEGLLMKKVCFTVKTRQKNYNDEDEEEEEGTYKFGVFNTGDWLEKIQQAIQDYDHDE